MKLFNEFTNLYVDTSVSTSVQAMLDNHFKYREVCDDDHFEFFWKRNINRYYDKFVKLQLTELVTDFDTDFKTSVNTILSNTSNSTDTKTGSDKNSNTSNSNTTNTITSDSTNKQLDLNTPQSIQYSATQNASNSLDWTYVSRQSETSSRGSDTSSNTDSTNTNTTTYNSSVSTVSTSSGDTTSTSSGYNTSQTMRYRDAYNFISSSDSFMWFVSKLEICFLGIYENE